MFKLIKSIISLAMFVGVVFLGYQIFKKSTEIHTDLTEQKASIEQKVDQLKEDTFQKKGEIQQKIARFKDAARQNAAVEKTVQKVKKITAAEDDDRAQPEKFYHTSADAKPTEVAASKPDTVAVLNPIDEEDRYLTARVLGETTTAEKAVDDNDLTAERSTDQSEAEKSVYETPVNEPRDLERMAKIRDLYSNAAEILDWE